MGSTQASYAAQPRSLPDHVEGLPPFTGPELKLTTRRTVCEGLGRGVYELPPVLPRELCASVADEVKQRVKEGKWKSLFTRLPTRDVPVDDLTAREDMYRAIDASCHLVTLCTGQEVTYNRRQTCVTVYDSVAEDTCCVCLETLKLDACLRPCQHMMCDTCAQQVDRCPLCRERVVKVDSAANFSGMPMHLDGNPTSTSPTLLITLDGLGGWSYRSTGPAGWAQYKLEPPVGGGMMVPGNVVHGDLKKCGFRLVLIASCRQMRESEKASLVENQRAAARAVFGCLDKELVADAEAAARAARDAAAFLRAEQKGAEDCHAACRYGSARKLKEFLDAGWEDEQDMNRALCQAASMGRVDMIRMLLDHGVAADASAGGGRQSPLFFAAAEGRLDAAKMLIDAGADACFMDDNGFSPLMVAAKLQHTEVARLLISKGANVEGSSTVAAIRTAMEAEEEGKRRAAERWRGTARNAASRIVAAAGGALTSLAAGWAIAEQGGTQEPVVRPHNGPRPPEDATYPIEVPCTGPGLESYRIRYLTARGPPSWRCQECGHWSPGNLDGNGWMTCEQCRVWPWYSGGGHTGERSTRMEDSGL